MSRKLPIILIVLAMTLGWTWPNDLNAEERGWYGGFAAGMSDVKSSLSDWDDSTLVSGEITKDSLGYKAYAGYRFTPRYWLETGYLVLGDVKMSGVSTGGFLWNKGPISGKIQVQGLNISGVLAQPIGPSGSIFAKAGLFAWDTTMTQDTTILSELKTNDDGVDFSFGAGAEFRIIKKLMIRAEWEHMGVTFASVVESSATLASIGLLWDL